MDKENVKDIAEYIKEHPVAGFNLIDDIDYDYCGGTNADAMLLYEHDGGSGIGFPLFINKCEDGKILYSIYLVTDEISLSKRLLMQSCFFLLCGALRFQEGSVGVGVRERRGKNEVGYTISATSNNPKYLKNFEHKVVSLLLWTGVFVAVLDSINGI